MDASKTRFLVLGLLVVGLGIVLGTALWLRMAPDARLRMGGSADDERLKMYGSVPEFALTERNGEVIQLAQLRGKIWIADFIYTNCQDTCPLQTATMAKLQEEFAARPEIQLVSFSVDPERDTPRVLTEYAGRYHADAKRWFFLTGQRRSIVKSDSRRFSPERGDHPDRHRHKRHDPSQSALCLDGQASAHSRVL